MLKFKIRQVRYLTLAVMLLAVATASAQGDKKYATVAQRKQFYQQISEKYGSSSTKEIFNHDKGNLFDTWVHKYTEKDLVKAYSTVIHEMLHSYNGGKNIGTHVYFIEPGVRIEAPVTKYYNSKELNKVVRKTAQDSIFRYGLYVGGKSELPDGRKVDFNADGSEVMSVIMGIYGMIEEFDAYYHDNLAEWELYGYFKDTYGMNNEDVWSDYRYKITSASVAYYEFRLFIGWYLLNAKKSKADVYKETMDNKALRVVYTLIDDKYRALVKQVDERAAGIKNTNELDAISGLDFSGSDDDIYRFCDLTGAMPDAYFTKETVTINGVTTTKYVGKKNDDIYKMMKQEYQKFAAEFKKAVPNRQLLFFGDPEGQVKFLKSLTTAEVENELEAYRIQGVTPKNWKEFVK